MTVSITAYNATGELDIRRDPFTLGTRVLLTCDVTGLPEDSEAVSCKWYHNTHTPTAEGRTGSPGGVSMSPSTLTRTTATRSDISTSTQSGTLTSRPEQACIKSEG